MVHIRLSYAFNPNLSSNRLKVNIMDKKKFLRQYISPFVDGPNFDAILSSLADEVERLDDLTIKVNDQLTISTASGSYLEKLLANLGITKPSELGMEDLAFRQMGIQVNAQKQITESIHAILATFYGDNAVKAFTTSTVAGPYSLGDQDNLLIMLEDGKTIELVINADEFEDIQNISASELSDVITRFIRSFGYNGYAQPYLDVDTGLEYVQIFGGAAGPYSMIQILGGRIQNQLEFPDIRGTLLPVNDTVWEVTRNIGSTYRFRWVGGSKPTLSEVLPEDIALIYGGQFESQGISGSFTVSDSKPAAIAPAYNAGFFEVQIPGLSILKSSAPDVAPPPNSPGAIYSFTLTQNSFDDLKFFFPRKNIPSEQIRYSLAWETTSRTLKVYMPATTKVVKRDLIGSAHLHLLYGKGEFNGTFGSATEVDQKIEIVNDYTVRYPQSGADALGYGGDVNGVPVEYIFRENGYTTVVCTSAHGITGTPDDWGRIISNDVISVNITDMMEDDPVNKFLGAYVIDPTAPYTLTSKVIKTRERISVGEIKTTLMVDGNLPDSPGYVLFGLNNDTQEGPIKYLGCQGLSSLSPVTITSISQIGTVVTVLTQGEHRAVAGQKVDITGTTNFNGSWEVTSTPAENVYTFDFPISGTNYELGGSSTPVVEGAISTLTLDPGYVFKNTQESQVDVTLLSDTKAYEPLPDGSDYGFYVTGTVDGRIYAAQLIQMIVATGIKLEIVIVYPSDRNFGNMGGSDSENKPPTSDKVFIWGPDLE